MVVNPIFKHISRTLEAGKRVDSKEARANQNVPELRESECQCSVCLAGQLDIPVAWLQ